jgi:hypothetical protein
MFRAPLNFNELRDIGRLYATLPVLFTDPIMDRLVGLLHILWPPDSDIPTNDKKRQTLVAKFTRRLSVHEPLEGGFPNVNPFNAHVRAVVRFDLFAQNCVKARVHPFKDYEFKTRFPDLTLKQFGRWIQGSVPDCHNDAVNRYLKESLGPTEFVPFWPQDARLSDLTLLALGYLTVPNDDSLCTTEYWGGDRRFPSGDKRLLITDLCRGLPIFHWLSKKKWKFNPRTQEFTIVDPRFNHKWWLTTCSKYAENRFRYWLLHHRLLITLGKIDAFREERDERQRSVSDTGEIYW